MRKIFTDKTHGMGTVSICELTREAKVKYRYRVSQVDTPQQTRSAQQHLHFFRVLQEIANRGYPVLDTASRLQH